ncbi:alpha/beta hydrolase [Aspergillus clavatus NRRL 1]|uniref:Alpha/beta hydrolase fold-3 domain-containing protein n=1 Tax=Aspergillus clavatus (strain ATCC 1007 / CBS 513.65 / DSM 816 / NCTC 3887 / NRRL 1 / QM 1276 / 107) TaxID=344612 RepID=A1CA87_ASPCL|nr:uncharacterized protein ACLA_010810 [Aspergillus clavatus NRRL 1]EAW12655.1 hypothetical protein ACLA_010810 [Aspergillus clavatus NRRL 1]
MSIPRPPLNADLAEAHKNIPLLELTTQAERDTYRASLNAMITVDSILRGKEDTITYTDVDIPGPAGPLRATIFAPKHRTRPAATTPGILHLHGGGLATGNRFLGLTILDCVDALGAICVTVEYRLAPEHPQPAALDDGVDWLSTRQDGDLAPVTAAGVRQVAAFALGAGREGALAGLPETFIDVGEADVFRDQDVAYAMALWRDGVAAERHVWPGAWHGFDVFVPEARTVANTREVHIVLLLSGELTEVELLVRPGEDIEDIEDNAPDPVMAFVKPTKNGAGGAESESESAGGQGEGNLCWQKAYYRTNQPPGLRHSQHLDPFLSLKINSSAIVPAFKTHRAESIRTLRDYPHTFIPKGKTKSNKIKATEDRLKHLPC